MSSITDILRSPSKESVALREFLLAAFPTPKFKHPYPATSPYIAASAPLVGKAFDYLLRFELERKFPEKVQVRPWVAVSALRYFNGEDRGIRISTSKLSGMSDEEILNFAKQQTSRNVTLDAQVTEKFTRCVKLHHEYINGMKVLPDDILDTCLFLGQLDDLIRVGPHMKMYVDAGHPNPDNLADLKNLYTNLDTSVFTPRQFCILNPTFGKSAKFVGADGDLIIDDTLIDIKTIKDAKIDRTSFNQIIAYYLLYCIGGITNNTAIQINTLAIYLSRYNYMWRMPLSKIGSTKDIDKATTLLKVACKKR